MEEITVYKTCFGQVLGTLYYHLREALIDGVYYEIIKLNIYEDKFFGDATIKLGNEIQYWYFDSKLEIWIIE